MPGLWPASSFFSSATSGIAARIGLHRAAPWSITRWCRARSRQHADPRTSWSGHPSIGRHQRRDPAPAQRRGNARRRTSTPSVPGYERPRRVHQRGAALRSQLLAEPVPSSAAICSPSTSATPSAAPLPPTSASSSFPTSVRRVFLGDLHQSLRSLETGLGAVVVLSREEPRLLTGGGEVGLGDLRCAARPLLDDAARKHPALAELLVLASTFSTYSSLE